jgi:ribonuclease Y
VDINLADALVWGAIFVGGLFLGIGIGVFAWHQRLKAMKQTSKMVVARAEADARELASAAEREARVIREQQLVEGREEALVIREEAAKEAARRREEVERGERRLADREVQVGERQDRLRIEERAVEQRKADLTKKVEVADKRQADLDVAHQSINQQLERVAGLTAADAAREVRQAVEAEARTQGQAIARDIRDRARHDAEKDARRIIANTTQRLAAEHTAETTVSAVTLPNDEMKGRIIGREGRNIRTFELATGVDVIIDDTPDTVVVSCFDPIRREIARRALAALVTDGRIHPGRIEELVVKAKGELEAELMELGERAAFEVDVHGLHPELMRLVGRMRYRTSYGQNMYEHSKEVAWIAGMMAAELHGDVKLARRGGLLHDVGKVLTHEHEGTHVQLGVEMARKFGESEAVINCIEAHHDDVPHNSTESVLVQAADAISGSRPGARREAFETYVKRLEGLEKIASSYRGVDRVFAIQAGREIRVIVNPEDVDDARMQSLTEEIARRVETELQYPGQIKVVAIREKRAMDIAR